MLVLNAAMVFALLSGATATDEKPAESAAEILDRLQETARSIRTIHMKSRTRRKSDVEDYRASSEIWMLRKGETILMRRDEAIRVMDYLSDPIRIVKMQEIEISDGTQRWREWNVDGQVSATRQNVTPSEPLAPLRALCDRGQGTVLGSQELLGEPCVVIRFQDSKQSEKSGTTVWISGRTGIVLQMFIQDPGGMFTRMSATELEVGADVDEALFAYSPPPGVSVKDLTGEPGPEAGVDAATGLPQTESGHVESPSESDADRHDGK